VESKRILAFTILFGIGVICAARPGYSIDPESAKCSKCEEKHPVKKQPACHSGIADGPMGGGGELPSPFDTANWKVELADGEAYQLMGRIVLMQTPGYGEVNRLTPFFRVDLNEHPWLATEKRLSDPYYPLIGPVEEWRPYVNRGKVKFPCIARGVIKITGSRPSFVIHLQASEDMPILFSGSSGSQD